MKQDAVNTFSEGLNYDFNSTTTPNNVLTDCINGTFLTFNGDELALQNDAGNTTIKYLETDVHLTPGFYPLGIKEYGGVLYIISGKYPENVVVEYDPLITYNIGDIVYTTILDVNYYFECLISNDGTLPTSTISTEDWLYIGIEKDFINACGQIEFGSYPSPEIINADIFNTSTVYNLINEISTPGTEFKLELYKPKIINSSIFRAGVYVNFQKVFNSTLVADNISYDAFIYDTTYKTVTKNAASYKNIYKVKLYHQLTNGYIDLTDNVWEQYAKYVGIQNTENLNMTGPPKFWFNDSNFNYHCPHNFKGKLVMSIELEELDIFKLDTITIDYTDPNYIVSFNLNYANSTQWNQFINPNTCTIFYTTDGSEPDITVSPTGVLFDSTIGLAHNDVSSFQVSFNNTVISPATVGPFVGKTMKYKIVPEFYFNGTQIAQEDITEQFLDLHTISGAQLITSELAGIRFIKTLENSCEVGYTGFRIAKYLDLVNANNENINNNLEFSEVPYRFYLDEETAPDGISAFNLGYYTLDALGYAVVTESSLNPLLPLLPSSKDYILSIVNNTPVKVVDASCARTLLTVIVNASYGVSMPLVVMQNGSSVAGTAIYNDTYIFEILPNVEYTISAHPDLYGKIIGQSEFDYIDTTSGSKTVHYGFMLDIELIGFHFEGGIYNSEDYLFIDTPVGYADVSAGYLITQTNSGYTDLPSSQTIPSGQNSLPIFSYKDDFGAPTYILDFGTSTNTVWENFIAHGIYPDIPIYIDGYSILSPTYTL